MTYTFSVADPVVKSCLLQSYCLSLYGSALWKLSCPAIHSIEVSFNNILRRIWHLPCNCHTRILHLTARLPRLVNVIISRAASLLSSALSCSSLIVLKVNWACWRTPILGIMPCLVAYMPSSTTRRRGYVRQSSVTSVCLGPARTMTLMRWLILFVLISA